MQGHHTRDLGIGPGLLVILTLNIHQTYNGSPYFLFFLYTYAQPKGLI